MMPLFQFSPSRAKQAIKVPRPASHPACSRGLFNQRSASFLARLTLITRPPPGGMEGELEQIVVER